MKPLRGLQKLAEQYGIQTAYRDMGGRTHLASPEVLLATLKFLGCPIATVADLPESIRMWQQATWQRCVEPVIVMWEGMPGRIRFRIPLKHSESILGCHLEFEEGGVLDLEMPIAQLRTTDQARVEGVSYLQKELVIPKALPWGYHQALFEVQGKFFKSTLIVSPRKAFVAVPGKRLWGVFLPLYALSSQQNGGSGNVMDLGRVSQWMSSQGGRVIGTLPMLSSFFREQFEPSPYSPVSRLFWNEFYIDVQHLPEGVSREKKSLTLLGNVARLRHNGQVDYRRQMALKRRILERAAGHFFNASRTRSFQAFERFVAARPRLQEYARFRAVSERKRTPWTAWPASLQKGLFRKNDFDTRVVQYHLYVQWVIDQQLKKLSHSMRTRGHSLYLDFPLGVHPHGYDVWCERESFVQEASCGAPPDPTFRSGQDWGFPPLHPEAIREEGYRYYIDCIRHHLQYAKLLRIDHVMGYHRLFWVPRGFQVRDGVYVRYHHEEFYAILALESHRHRALVAGENLGTVPPEVHSTMDRHALQKLFVIQYELFEDRKKSFVIPENVVASLNTHDMLPFTAFWKTLQAKDKTRLLRFLGLSQTAAYTAERMVQEVLRAVLKRLSRSRARILLVNLEDLWGETQPQNVPGTGKENPNWRRKMAYPFEQWSRRHDVRSLLKEVDHNRRIKTS